MTGGRLVGVLVTESPRPAAFDDADVAVLSVVATLVAAAVEADRAHDDPGTVAERRGRSGERIARRPSRTDQRTAIVLHSSVDGSVFIGGE